MDNKQLTLKQKQFLDYIVDYKDETGILPTYQKIMEHFSYKSPNSVTQNIDSLLRKGYLAKENGQYFLTDKVEQF